MAVSKIFRNGMVLLAVCLGLLALAPGLPPAYANENSVRVGGGSQMSWGKDPVFSPNALSISDAFVVNEFFGRRVFVAGKAKAAPGVVGVSATQGIIPGNTLPTEAGALATASFNDITITDLNDPTVRSVPSSFDLFMDGTLDVRPSNAGEVGILFTIQLNGSIIGRLQMIKNGAGTLIVADTFGINNIFNVTTGRIIGTVKVSTALNWNAPNVLLFTAAVSSFAQFGDLGTINGDFFNTISFPTTGPVFTNLPPGVTVNGGGIVNNHYTNPFAARAATQSALPLLLLDD